MSEIMYMKAKNYDHAPRPILGLGPFSMVGTMRDLICIFMNMLVHMSKLFPDLHNSHVIPGPPLRLCLVAWPICSSTALGKIPLWSLKTGCLGRECWVPRYPKYDLE